MANRCSAQTRPVSSLSESRARRDDRPHRPGQRVERPTRYLRIRRDDPTDLASIHPQWRRRPTDARPLRNPLHRIGPILAPPPPTVAQDPTPLPQSGEQADNHDHETKEASVTYEFDDVCIDCDTMVTPPYTPPAP